MIMRRVLFEWRGIKIYAYPALLFAGIVVGVIAGSCAAATRGLDPARTFAAMLVLVAPALVGARLLYVTVHWRNLPSADRRLWRPTGGGAALFGGLVLSFLVSLPLLNMLALPVGPFWDATTITLLSGMILTRIGCLLNGCCAGRPSRSPLALNLPNVHGVWRRRWPTQLFEAGVAVALLAFSLSYFNRAPFGGALFLATLTAYGIARSVLESTRETSGCAAESMVNRALALGLAAGAGAVFWYVAQGETSMAWLFLVPGAESAGGMNAWYFLLAPLAVLAVLLLFGFVGCGSVLGVTDVEIGVPYAGAVAADGPSAWWRLQESDPPVPTSGGTAKDELGALPGIFTQPATGYPENATTRTIGAPSPVKLNLGVQPGLLATDTNVRAMEVHGGFVRIANAGGLFQGSFTIEVLVSAQWDLTKPGFFLPVLSCRDPASRNKGFVLYAGPDPNDPAKYVWQLRAGTGTSFVPLVARVPDPVNDPRPGDELLAVKGNIPAYLVVRYEFGLSALYAAYYHDKRNMDWLTYVLPLPSPASTFAPPAPASELLIGIEQPSIMQVQSTGITTAGLAMAGVALTFAQATTTGNLLVISLALNSGGLGPVTATITDNFNNTWKQACRAQTSGGNPFSAEIWYAENCKAGANHTVTVTPSTGAYVVYSLAEYTGVATANALDQKSTKTADFANPSTAINSGNVTTASARQLYVGVAQWAGVGVAAMTQANWTKLFDNTPSADSAAVSVETIGEATDVAAGILSAAWTLPSARPWAACIATFLPAAPIPFQGKIQDVAIYKKLLSPERLLTHGAAGFNV